MLITFNSAPRLDDPPTPVVIRVRKQSKPVSKPAQTAQQTGYNIDEYLRSLDASNNAEDKAVQTVGNMEKCDNWQGYNVYRAPACYNPLTLQTEDRYFICVDVIIQYDKETGEYKVLSAPDPNGNSYVDKQFVMVKKLGNGSYQVVNRTQYSYTPTMLKDCVANAMQKAEENKKCEDFDAERFVKNSGFEEYEDDVPNGWNKYYYTIWKLDEEDAPFKDIKASVLKNFNDFVDLIANAMVKAGKCAYDRAVNAGKTLKDYFAMVISNVICKTTDRGNCTEAQETYIGGSIRYSDYMHLREDGYPEDKQEDFGAVSYISSNYDSDVNTLDDFFKLEDKVENPPQRNGIFVGCNRSGDDRYNIFVDVVKMVELFKHFCGIN